MLRSPFNSLLRSAFLLAALGLSPGASAQVEGKARYDHGNPTDLEQLALELVNRARHDPAAEAANLGIELNAGLSPNHIGGEAKQPLAFHPYLLEAARQHSIWMLDKNEFSHTGAGGSNGGDRMAAAGYLFFAPYLWGENIAWEGVKGLASPVEMVRRLHRAVFASPTHRLNLLDGEHNAAGFGLQDGDYRFEGHTYRAFFLTENFARSAGTPEMAGPFVTGVAYRDGNGNGQYDPGEGKSGIRLTIEGGRFETFTTSSGGYALPVPEAHRLRLRLIAEEAGRPCQIREIQLAESRNVKVDFVERVLPRRVLVGAQAFASPFPP